MFLDRKKHTESAYIGEELLPDAGGERIHQCMIVQQTIADGTFTLEQALEAYEVGRDEYEDFLAKSNFNHLMGTLHSNSPKTSAIMYIHIMDKMLLYALSGNKSSKRMASISRTLRQLSQDIEEEKVSI